MATPDVLEVVVRADHVPGPPQGRWTYDDYAALPADGKRYEIIDGVLYMSPAPDLGHQSATGRIYVELLARIELAGLGRAYIGPVDVELPPSSAVIKPDSLVVLNAHLDRLAGSRIIGAPDLVVKVASPSTATYDRRVKMDAYARAGVPEYWIADHRARTIEPFFLEGGEYRSAGVFQGPAITPSRLVPRVSKPVDHFFG